MNLSSIVDNALPALWNTIPNPFAKTDQDLLVLRVSLTLWEGSPHAVLDLTGYGKVSDTGRRTWRLLLKDIGVSENLVPESALEMNFPLQLQEGLRASLAVMNPASNLPLWLNLVRPYGYLGMLPWERVLGNLLDRPVLRLPDFLERPHENTDILESAILFDLSPQTPTEKAIGQLKSAVDEMLSGSSRLQTRINVFTSELWTQRLGAVSFDKRVHLHLPEKASASIESSREKADDRSQTSPWLDWICAALEGRSLDAIHFVCRAQATETRAGLLLSSSPFAQEETVTLSLVDIVEIGSALTRVGAWAAIFSPSPDDPVVATMAFVADAFAHSRPGSTLYHPAKPEDAQSLRQSFKFLFSPKPSRPPKLVNGFIYCQPTTVAVHASFQTKVILDAVTQNAPTLEKAVSFVDRTLAKAAVYIPALAPDLKQAPNWASAAQRYIEGATLEQLRRSSTDVLFTKATAAIYQITTTTQSETVQQTLSDIQKIVGNYLQKSGKA